MDSTVYRNWIFVICALAQTHNQAYAVQQPCNFTMVAYDFAFSLDWEFCEVSADDVTPSPDDESMSPINDPTRNFTVFYLELMASDYDYDSYDYKLEEIWVPVKGCIEVTGKKCQLDEVLEYATAYTFWITDSDTNTSISLDDVDEAQIYYYFVAEEKMPLSPPEFDAVRSKSDLLIVFKPKTLDLWNNGTIPEYLYHFNFHPIYLIEYWGKYDDDHDTDANITKQGIHTKRISALDEEFNLTTSISNDIGVCVRIQLINDDIAKSYRTDFNEICLPRVPHNENVTSTFHPRQKSWLLVCLIVLAFVIIVGLVCVCRRYGRKLFKRLFSIKKIEIPDVIGDPYIEGREIERSRMLVAKMELENKETPDVYEWKQNKGDMNVTTDSESHLLEVQVKESAIQKDSCDCPSYDVQSGTPFVPDDEVNHLVLYDEAVIKASPHQDVIFYENRPGPYVTSSQYITSEEAFRQNRKFSKSPRQDSVECSVVGDGCFSKTARSSEVCPHVGAVESTENGKKQRFISEDSAFFDDSSSILACSSSSTKVFIDDSSITLSTPPLGLTRFAFHVL